MYNQRLSLQKNEFCKLKVKSYRENYYIVILGRFLYLFQKVTLHWMMFIHQIFQDLFNIYNIVIFYWISNFFFILQNPLCWILDNFLISDWVNFEYRLLNPSFSVSIRLYFVLKSFYKFGIRHWHTDWTISTLWTPSLLCLTPLR